MPYSDYDTFAWTYNQHWAGFSEMLMPILEALFLDRLPPGARLLDVGCGTGHVTRLLLARGYRVTGLDGSAEMLRYARQNAPAAELLHLDARNFSLPPVYHGALSTFDSLNHILALPELEAAFRNIAAALLPGGWFTFDLNMEPGYVAGWNGQTGDSFEDHAYIWKNSYDPERKLARFEATLFRLEAETWRRSDITLWQKAYTRLEVTAALRAAGFTAIAAYQFNDELALVPLDEEGRRGFFICRRG